MSQAPHTSNYKPPPPPKDDVRAQSSRRHHSEWPMQSSSEEAAGSKAKFDEPGQRGQSQPWKLFGGPVENKLAKKKIVQMERDELTQQLDLSNLQLAEAQDLLEQYTRTIEHQRSENEKLMTLFEHRDLSFGQQAPDDEIVRKYSIIETKVKAWSRFLSNEGDFQAVRLQDDELSRFNKILPSISDTRELKSFLEDKAHRKLVARAWVHRVLYEDIFNRRRLRGQGENLQTTMNLWMGNDVAAAMETFDSILVQNRKIFTAREINDWRAYTVGLLSRTNIEEDSKSTQWYVEGIQRTVRSIMSLNAKLLATNTFLDPAINGIKEIVLMALELSKFIRRQRALWTVAYPGNPVIQTTAATEVLKAAKRQEDALLFDPETMEDKSIEDALEEANDLHDQPSGKSVLIMMVPALYKRGSADGTNYDEEACFVKASVFCK